MNYIYEAKELLKGYSDYKNANKNLSERLEKLNADLQNVKAISYDDMPHGSSANPDDKLCNMIFERDRTITLLKKNQNEIDRIDEIINNLDAEHKDVLIMAYVEDLPEIVIINKLNIARRTFYRYKGEAIRSLARQYFGIKVSGL